MELSPKETRQLILDSQGLWRKNQFGQGLAAVQKTIERLHYVQIDTISVVARAHNHILKTRVDDFQPEMLHSLLKDQGAIFEYWAHAAAYLPMSDYRFYLPIKQGYRDKGKVDKKLRSQILKRIKTEGPLQSRDFENLPGKKSNGWWDWKPAKRAMEIMYLSGELMVKERKGFQKVFDLPENVLSDNVDLSWPSEEERGQFYVRRMLGAQGIASAKHIGYNRATIKSLSSHNIQPAIDRAIEELMEQGEVQRISVAKKLYYSLSQSLGQLGKSAAKKQLSFLSPFDNLVINRERLAELFDFDYVLECYVPAPKRRFGYFILPILRGDKLIGRIDCKAYRKDSLLQVNNIWLEAGVKLSEAFIHALFSSLLDYQLSLQCQHLRILETDHKKLKPILLDRIGAALGE